MDCVFIRSLQAIPPEENSEKGKVDELANFSLVQEAAQVDWADFERYLKAEHRDHTVKMRMLYAKKYHWIITTPDGPQRITQLQSLGTSKRKEVMCALANLAKYMGVYNGWRQLKEEHDLRWTRFDPEAQAAVFQEIFYNQENDFSALVDYVKGIRQQLSQGYAAYIDFLVLTGLRPDEGCHAINILLNNHENYFNKKKMTLEHFRFPTIFIRRTKKAYISLVTPSLLEAIETIRSHPKDKIADSYYDFYHKLEHKIEENPAGETQLKNHAQKYGKKLAMNTCRKIYGTYMRMNGIETEFINLLQGRVASASSKSPEEVFARHYYRPDFDVTAGKVRNLTEKLYQDVTGNSKPVAKAVNLPVPLQGKIRDRQGRPIPLHDSVWWNTVPSLPQHQ